MIPDGRPSGVAVSALDMFSVGIGPSSSHTVGPMRAAAAFAAEIDRLGPVDRITCHLHGSLAATGVGHGTPDAVLAGLRGLDPRTCDPALVHGRWAELVAGGRVEVGRLTMTRDDIVFEPRARHHGHPNALTLAAYHGGREQLSRTYLSVGGGFVVPAGETGPEQPSWSPARQGGSDHTPHGASMRLACRLRRWRRAGHRHRGSRPDRRPPGSQERHIRRLAIPRDPRRAVRLGFRR